MTWYREKTIMKFDETDICDIARFVLKFYFQEPETLNKVLNEFRQEIRRKTAYPDYNVFGDQLCPICRENYMREGYKQCMSCALLKRTKQLDESLTKDSSES